MWKPEITMMLVLATAVVTAFPGATDPGRTRPVARETARRPECPRRGGRSLARAAIPPRTTAQDAPPAVDPILGSSLDLITATRVAALVAQLTGERPVTIGGARQTLTSRAPFDPEGEPATQYALEQLQRAGFSAAFHEWSAPPWGATRNVVAERRGESRPDEIVILCAHIDNGTWPGGWPGADDNASGTAAVLLAADVLGRHRFERTVRLILFQAEEYGVLGSTAYVAEAWDRGENIVDVVNLDMLGNDSGGRRAIVFADTTHRPAEGPIASAFADVVETYGLGLVPSIAGDCG